MKKILPGSAIRLPILLAAFSLIFTGCHDALGGLLEAGRLGDVTNVSARILESGKSIEISWKSAKNAYGYYVTRSTEADGTYTQVQDVTWITVYPDDYNYEEDEEPDPILPATCQDTPSVFGAYYYKVQAYSRAGSSTNNTSKPSQPIGPVVWSP